MDYTSKWQIIELPKVTDSRGSLTFIEGAKHIPFEIKRVYYLYDVPGGTERAGHALKECKQFLIAISGSFDVIVDNGTRNEKFTLNRSYYGLYIPPMTWRVINNFSSGAVCLSIVSTMYNPEDYFRDYDEFIIAVKRKL
ncbi:MAG: sugar 3,4-ketoisomerase [Pseudanabaenaceae cyanobacterium]